jgi:uncharacterized membrane protein
VLLLGFAVLALVLVGVVADLSKVFLAKRALASTADGAAIAAAQALDLEALYTGTAAPGDLPIDARAADAAARGQLARDGSAAAYDGFALDSVEATQAQVTVRVSARVALLFGAFVGGPDGVRLGGTATARSPLR